ncbi:MAG TPA: DinB family protein [Candidatus Acidoferrales bacterium]|nr:DinB family protein [Candidatus Acidoferrales bacterium]
MTPLVPELERIRFELEAASAGARALCDGLGDQELGWRPEPGRRSIAENLIHLELTARTFLPVIDKAIERARAEKCCSPGPFRLGMMGRFYLWWAEPPPPFRVRAPKVLAPLFDGPASEALPRFLDSQSDLLRSIERANGLDLSGVRITSPLASFIKMSLLAVFAVSAGHERRHLWQAGNVRRQLPRRESCSTDA